MTKVLLLGAGALQVPGIVRARELGYHIAVIDRDVHAPGVRLADEFFELSTTDVDGVLEVARRYQPDGILTMGSDFPMRAVAAVCEVLSLPGPSLSAAFAATDKSQMASAFALAGVPSPQSVVSGSLTQLQELTAAWTLPVILKPVDNSGSRGVSLVEEPGEFAEAFAHAQSNSRSSLVIAQEFLRGREISVEGFCHQGKVDVVAITDKLTTGAPNFVELGHSQPSTVSDGVRDHIIRVCEQAAAALGVDMCAMHAELMVTERGPAMIEFGARLGGDFITTELVPLSTGVDMVRAMLQLCTGEEPELTPTRRQGSAIRFLTGIRTDPEPELVRRIEELAGVVDVSITPRDLDRLRSSLDRCGQVVASAATAEEAVDICERAVRVIQGRTSQ